MAQKILCLRWVQKPARMVWVWYVRTLETRPLFTQAATTGSLLYYVLPVLNRSLEQLSRSHLRPGRCRGTAVRGKERQEAQLEKIEKHGCYWLPVHGRLATDPSYQYIECSDPNSRGLLFVCAGTSAKRMVQPSWQNLWENTHNQGQVLLLNSSCYWICPQSNQICVPVKSSMHKKLLTSCLFVVCVCAQMPSRRC